MSVIVLFAVACKNNTEKSEKQQTEVEAKAQETTSATPLKDALEARKKDFAAKADEQKKQIYKEGIEAVAKSGIITQAKNVGDIAPDFTLTNATGDSIKLQELLKEGPIVLTWYRGGWCPYCNLTLKQLQNELPNFKANGANLVALTPELPDKSLSTTEKNELDFHVLSDIDNKIAKEYGIVFKLTDEVADIYNKSFGVDTYNGNDKNELPLAATYIINKEGKIIYAFLDADYRNRAEPSELTKVLKNI